MIKILHIITDTNIGGAGRLLVQYLKCFDRTRFDIVVAVPCDSLLIPEIVKVGYRVIPTQKGHDQSWEKGAVAEYKKIIRAEKPDIVHTHSSLAGKVAAFLVGVKSRVYTRHCTFVLPRKMTTFPGKQVNGLVNGTLATRIVAVSQKVEDDLIQTGVNPKKITVIMNGVEQVREISYEERLSFRQKLGIGQNEFVCLISARLEDYKGHSYLLDTAREVQDTLQGEKRVRFIFMGEGSAHRALEEKAKRLNVDNCILFTGFVDDVAPYCNIMDLNLNCSWGTEASSLALAEGMSLGKPAVVTDFGGNPYMVKEGVSGFVVPQKDAHAMAESILKLIRCPQLLEQLSLGARKEYEAKFTSRVMTKQLETLYQEEAKRIGKESSL